MKLWAISDLHVGYPENRAALQRITPRPRDWLIIAGDVGETFSQLGEVFGLLGERFAKLVWVPGNHELWSHPSCDNKARGVRRYLALVELCRTHGVLTPEDPWPLWPGDDQLAICPLFVGFDYSFCPDGMSPAQARAWAAEHGIVSADERFLDPEPHPSLDAWCRDRVETTRRRLDELPGHIDTVLIHHWPLRADLVRLPSVPRFSPWCGTRATEDWHLRYRARVVVNGHLHMRATDWRDHVRFEEVAIGYPRHWKVERGIDSYLREIVPGTIKTPPSGQGGPRWHR
ncbi:MAG TPA: metallophosphoesterase [Myxococcota bacterium]|nr:metallophosphoesterase [Myxococcota bacterium]